MDDVTLGEMLTAAHRSENTRTEKVVDRSGQLDECHSSNAQFGTLLEEQRQTIIAEYRGKVGHHELQAAHAEEDRRLLQGQNGDRNWNFVKLINRVLHKWNNENSRVLPSIRSRDESSSRIRTTIFELLGRVQELQNEVKLYERFSGFSGC